MRLLEVWVKSPMLREAELLIASECLRGVNPQLLEELARGKVLLTVCPESDGSSYYGKLASIIRSSNPRSLTVVTVDGSPHCFQVHAAVNEAAYVLGRHLNRTHYVVVDGRDLVRISPEAVRVARYLSLVDKLVRSNPAILKELERHSLEYKLAKETRDAEL